MSKPVYTFKDDEIKFGKTIEFLNDKIDDKTKYISDFIYDFYKKRDKSRKEFFLNFSYIQRYFLDKGNNDNYISFASVNRALQFINLQDNNPLFTIKRILVNGKQKDVKYRIEFVADNLKYCNKKVVTDEEKFLASVKANKLQYEKYQKELKEYNSNNHSFESVVKYRQSLKDNTKKQKDTKKKTTKK